MSSDYALNLAARYAMAPPRSWIIVTPGDYDLDSPCVLEGKPVMLDLRGVTFHVRQELNAPALSFGFADGSGSNNLNYGWTVLGGRVRWQDDGGLGYADNFTTGFRIRNVRKGRFDDLAVDGMGNAGIEMIGDGFPCTGNRLTIRDVRNCTVGFWDHAVNGGFSTYHSIDGGWFGQGDKPIHANHLMLAPGNGGGNSVFRGCYFQGRSGQDCVVADVRSGGFYAFTDCGWESDNHSKMPLTLSHGTYSCVLRGWTNYDFDWQDANNGTTKNVMMR